MPSSGIMPPFSIENGRYTVVAEIGRGAHAVVYRARDEMQMRDVALKILRADVTDRNLTERFRREVRITTQLEHPHILPVYASGEWESQLYFVTELAPHASLDKKLAADKQLSVDDAVRIATDVAEALHFAHKQGVVHRDVKPENVLLGDDGALLGDFGIARVVGMALEQALITSTGIAVGTLLYMSPEQICAERDIDGRSDQYSLALVLYEMLAGVRPHEAATVEGLRTMRISGVHHPVTAHRPMVPAHVNDAVMRALLPSPADRFADCAAFVRALRGESSTAEVRSVGLATDKSLHASSSRRRVAVASAFVALLAIGAWGVYQATGSAAEPAGAGTDIMRTRFAFASPDDDASAAVVRSLRAELTAWDHVQVNESGNDRGAHRLSVIAAPLPGDSLNVTLRSVHANTSTVLGIWRVAAGVVAEGVLREMAIHAVGGSGADSAPGIQTLRERSPDAVWHYVSAWRRLRSGNLDSAIVLFRNAGAGARDFPAAHYRLAQTLAWRNAANVTEWRAEAERASTLASRLPTVDSLNALALAALASRQYPEACALYRQAVGVEPRSFVALFGSGECLRLDRAVLRDGFSPTGYRFRSNHLDAIRAYTAALGELPSPSLGAMFGPVPRLTFASLQQIRTGSLVTNPAEAFSSFPTSDGDSVVFWPIRAERIAASESGTVPNSYMDAIRKGRTLLLTFATQWAQHARQSASAHLGLALALELNGTFDTSGAAGDRSALSSIDVARSVARTPAESLGVALAETRIHLRTSNVHRAAVVAKQALASRVTTSNASLTVQVASLAAFLGQDSTLAELASLPPLVPDGAAPAWLRARHGHAYSTAALRRCESVFPALASLDSGLVRYASRSGLPEARQVWLEPLARLASSCSAADAGAYLIGRLPFDRAVKLVVDNTSATRSVLDSLIAVRRGANASAVAWDFEFAESWLTLQLGDSLQAYRRLTAAVDDLASISEFVFDFPPQAAAIRHSIVGAAGIAATLGDRVREAKWRSWAQALGGM